MFGAKNFNYFLNYQVTDFNMTSSGSLKKFFITTLLVIVMCHLHLVDICFGKTKRKPDIGSFYQFTRLP